MTELTTAELLERIVRRANEAELGEAVAELVTRYRRIVYAQAVYRTGLDRSLADDVFQETFLRLFRWLSARRGELPEQSFARLLTTFARRAAVDIARKRARELPAVLPDTADRELRVEDALYAQELIETLDKRSGDVIRMTYFDGMEGEEIAKKLSLSPENVRVIRHRALEGIRERRKSDNLADSRNPS